MNGPREEPQEPIDWRRRLLLVHPEQVRANLRALRAAGKIEAEPTLWQMCMGVFYMLHRMFFRPETIGMSAVDRPRRTWRARLMTYRPLRFPFLLKERAVFPRNLTGLSAPPSFLASHLLGAYHPGDNATYDLEILSAYPGEMEALRARVAEVVEERTPRGAWLKDLCVYEGYHERLLRILDRCIAGDFGPWDGRPDNPDTTLRAFVRWCARQPATPGEAWRAWRRRELSFAPSA